MQQNGLTPEGAKSMPCIDVPTMLLDSPDHSQSPKSFNDATGAEVQPGGSATVKSLIKKYESFQGKLHDGNVSNFEIKEKPFIATAREKSSTPFSDRMNMVGDALVRVDGFKNIEKNHVFKIFTATTHFGKHNPLPLRFDRKDNQYNPDETVENPNTMDNVLFLANVNAAYRQCLQNIANKQKIKTMDAVRTEISLALREGEESEFMDSELIDFIKDSTEKLKIEISDSRLNDELNETHSMSHQNRLSLVQSDLEKLKVQLRMEEDQIARLEMDNSGLLEKLDGYRYENVDRVTLEVQIKSAQKKNDQLQKMIASAFEKKMRRTHYAREDSSSSYSLEN